jgi:predicted N-acetyltransferase YhbS
MRIRDARPEEYEAIGELVAESFAEYAPYFPPDESAAMTVYQRDPATYTREGRPIVAERDGRLVGVVCYHSPGQHDFPDIPYQKDWALMRLLAVPPSERGKGIAGALSDECVRRARQEGASVIGLHTSELMQVAQTMYEGMGFKRQGEFNRHGLTYWTYSLELG